jgi:ABC-type polysaccharide/polyol phosphate export permease
MLQRSMPLGIDLFCVGKKFLVFNIVTRNLKIKYRRSALGFFWTLLNPLAMAAVYYFVFRIILKVEIPNYLIFVLSGVLPWSFFAQTLMEGMESLVANWGLITKIPIPIQVFPFVGALTNLVTLFLSLPILILIAVVSGAPLGPSLLLLPIYFSLLFLLAYGVSWIAAMSYVYFRDLRHILSVGVQLWFYGTPVLYSETMIPEAYRWILFLNPVAFIITVIHRILVEGGWPTPVEFAVSFGWSALALFLALLIQYRVKTEILERI